MEFDREGRLEVEDGLEIWYGVVEGSPGVPLLTLHGGPGAGHDSLDSLADLAVDRTVIFYDQLGCGRSDQPDGPARWVIDRFVTEVDTVRSALGLDTVHLLGQSWGGWLAIEYMARGAEGVASLVLASTSASIAEFAAECAGLRAALPQDITAVLERYEATGDYEAPEYLDAVGAFYARHLCRLEELPDSVMRTFQNLDGNQVYLTMNGPNEFTTIGNLKDWDRSGQLGEIGVPTLITCGRYDELGPAARRPCRPGSPTPAPSCSSRAPTSRTSRSASATCRWSASSFAPTTPPPPERRCRYRYRSSAPSAISPLGPRLRRGRLGDREAHLRTTRIDRPLRNAGRRFEGKSDEGRRGERHRVRRR